MESLVSSVEPRADIFGTILVKGFHLLALFAIGAATVWSAVHAFMEMVEAGKASVPDILLLFIYLELGAMVGIYFKTNRMPVRFLIYVAITALTRLLIEVISETRDANLTVIITALAIVLLGIAELVLRKGAVKFAIAEGPAEIAVRPAARRTRRDGTTS